MSSPDVLHIICWQPVLTAHQLSTYEALAKLPGVEVTAVTSRADNAVKPGWLAKDSKAMPIRLLRERGWLREIGDLLADPNAVHIIATPFDRSRINVALLWALYRKRRVFLLSEPFATIPVGYFSDRRPWIAALKNRLRPGLYAVYGKVLRDRLAGIFAISPRAVAQFRRMGFAPERIYPFGYFVPPADVTKATRTQRLRCVFVGALIRRKGIATMLEAFAASPLLRERATLDIYGAGEIHPGELPEGVRYGGILPSGQTSQIMADADVVIVPSLFDGWAVVVNEAILAGTPVIASDAVGAAEMVRRWGCGRLFPAGDGRALAVLLEQLAGDRDELGALQLATEPLARALHPEVAARFLRDCILSQAVDRPAPEAPWY